jgi:diphosphomevalonate decarboxylase
MKVYHNEYIRQAGSMRIIPEEHSGEVSWQSPSNIALIKYWGKRDNQLPMNPSLSFTLRHSFTSTSVKYNYNPERKDLILEYYFMNTRHPEFRERIKNYLGQLVEFLPFIPSLELIISSRNSFPHSAGIASSASAFSALALCLLEIGNILTSKESGDEEFFRKASFLARLGSGSASRSAFGGVSLWGKAEGFDGSSDEFAIQVSNSIDPVFKTYRDTILLLDTDEKSVSSSLGHALMNTNPFAAVRYRQAGTSLNELLKVMYKGDLEEFIRIVEYEALSLHAMMLTSGPGYLLLRPESLEAIRRIRTFRAETHVPVCFTVDAGANIHVLYSAGVAEHAEDFIHNSLLGLCREGKYIKDEVGEGPVRVKAS